MNKGEVSDNIIIIGVLIIVSLTVVTSYLSLNRVELPKESEQEISGSNISAAAELSKLADSCWRKAENGQSSENIDCFSVKLYSNGSIQESLIKNNLQILNSGKFSIDGSNVPNGESSLKVSYRPVSNSINISVVDMCEAGAGDTCYSISCSCETVCGPSFDPDGDGISETDQKGCITNDYQFNATKSPCSALSCGSSTIYKNLNVVNSEITFDTGKNISLRDVKVKQLPTPSGTAEFQVRADEQFSPSEIVGTGSNQRKLFRGEASLNTSSLSAGDYGMYVWSCEGDTPPSNCQWRPYNFTIT